MLRTKQINVHKIQESLLNFYRKKKLFHIHFSLEIFRSLTPLCGILLFTTNIIRSEIVHYKEPWYYVKLVI